MTEATHAQPQFRDAQTRTTRRRPALTDLVVAVAIVLALVLRVLYVLRAPIDSVIYRITDDAYYYFNVARNIVLEHGVTFDQMNYTNGFHPLWMLCLIPSYLFTGADPDGSLRAVSCLLAAIAALSFFVAYRVAAERLGRASAVFGLCVMVNPFLLNHYLNGLETGLMILLIFLTIWACSRYHLLELGASLRRDILLGTLLALTFLARLDAAFFVIALFATILITGVLARDTQGALSNALRKCLVAGGTFSLIAAPYFLWNMLTYQHLMPISAEIKSTFPELSLHPGHALGVHGIFYVLCLTATLGMVLWGLSSPGSACARELFGGGGPLRFPSIILVLWIGCALHFLNIVLFMRGVYWWHFAIHVPLIVFFACLLFAQIESRLGGRRDWVIAALVATVAMSGGLHALDRRYRGVHHQPWYEAALWASHFTPDDAVFAMTDAGGLVGYFSERRTVNLDGVINSYAYQRALRDGKLRRFLEDCAVTHVASCEVHYAEDGTYTIRLPSRVYDGLGGAIVATRRAEVYRSEPYIGLGLARGGATPIRFVIWDYAQLEVMNSLSRKE